MCVSLILCFYPFGNQKLSFSNLSLRKTNSSSESSCYQFNPHNHCIFNEVYYAIIQHLISFHVQFHQLFLPFYFHSISTFFRQNQIHKTSYCVFIDFRGRLMRSTGVLNLFIIGILLPTPVRLLTLADLVSSVFSLPRGVPADISLLRAAELTSC